MANESNTQLDALAADMDKALRSARTGMTLTIILALASSALIGFWLVKANGQFLESATPETGIRYAASTIRESVPQYKDQLVKYATDSAPEVLNKLEAQVNEIPDQLADQLGKRTTDEISKIMPDAEKKMTDVLRAALKEQEEKRDKNITDEVFAKAVVDVLATTYGDESLKLLDDTHAQYSSTSKDLITYLQRLADDKGLTKQEQLQRQALVTFLTIAHRTQKSQG